MPIKYSIMAAKLFPIQEIRIPINGPKRAPLRITIGSVGIGVADKIPIKIIENMGPATPAFGIIFSISLKSF